MEHHGSPWNVENSPSHVTAPSSWPIQPLVAPSPPPFLRRASCDLFECIEQHSRLSEDTARYVFKQIAETVCHLASMGICHRDIKDENIVIDEDWTASLMSPFIYRLH